MFTKIIKTNSSPIKLAKIEKTYLASNTDSDKNSHCLVVKNGMTISKISGVLTPKIERTIPSNNTNLINDKHPPIIPLLANKTYSVLL